jgi:hypothetical protein
LIIASLILFLGGFILLLSLLFTPLVLVQRTHWIKLFSASASKFSLGNILEMQVPLDDLPSCEGHLPFALFLQKLGSLGVPNLGMHYWDA